MLNSPVSGDIEGFTDIDGRVYRYNKTNNEFAKAKPNGTIITFFKPGDTHKEGYKYWLNEIAKHCLSFN